MKVAASRYANTLNKQLHGAGPGRATGQAVGRRLATETTQAPVQVRSGHVMSCEVCGGQGGTSATFLRGLRLHRQFSFYHMPHTRLSSGAGTIGQSAADVPNAFYLTPSQEIKKEQRQQTRNKPQLRW
jgi:hypothetical protein